MIAQDGHVPHYFMKIPLHGSIRTAFTPLKIMWDMAHLVVTGSRWCLLVGCHVHPVTTMYIPQLPHRLHNCFTQKCECSKSMVDMKEGCNIKGERSGRCRAVEVLVKTANFHPYWRFLREFEFCCGSSTLWQGTLSSLPSL